MFEVVSNKTAPTSRSKYPFDKMNVGDSFEVTDQNMFASTRVAAIGYGKRKGQKFTSRSRDGVLTIWRTE